MRQWNPSALLPLVEIGGLYHRRAATLRSDAVHKAALHPLLAFKPSLKPIPPYGIINLLF